MLSPIDANVERAAFEAAKEGRRGSRLTVASAPGPIRCDGCARELDPLAFAPLNISGDGNGKNKRPRLRRERNRR